MDIKLFKETLAGLEGGDALLEFFQSHDNTLRGDIEKAKQKKGEVITEKSDMEKVLSGLLEKLQAKTPDEATGKITEFETKLKEALEGMGDLTEKFNLSEKEKAEAKIEKEKALLNSGVIEAISNKKLTDKAGIIRDTMLFRAKKDDDSGNYLIDGKSFDEFLQGQIDSEEPMFKEKITQERQPASKEPIVDDSAAREIMGLLPKE